MSLVFVDEDPWLKEYENCKALCSELSVRVESFLSAGGSGTDAADIRLRLRQCDQQLAQLRTSLLSDEPDRFITSDERERRERCLEALYDKAKCAKTQFTSPRPLTAFPADHNRELLFGSRVNEIPKGQVDDVSRLDPEVIRKRQAQTLEEQDRGLEELSKIIARQKNIARNIDSEVTNQTDIVTNLAESISRVGARTEGATRRTATLITTDNTCGYWVIAVLLFIAIIIVAVI